LLLGRRETAIQEMLSVVLHQPHNPRGFDDINAMANDGHGGRLRGYFEKSKRRERATNNERRAMNKQFQQPATNNQQPLPLLVVR
jgi:hypothetical protein